MTKSKFFFYNNLRISMTEDQYNRNLKNITENIKFSDEFGLLVDKILKNLTKYFPDYFCLEGHEKEFYAKKIFRKNDMVVLNRLLSNNEEIFIDYDHLRLKNNVYLCLNQHFNKNISKNQNTLFSYLFQLLLKSSLNNKSQPSLDNLDIDQRKLFEFIIEMRKSKELKNLIDKFKELQIYIENMDFNYLLKDYTKMLFKKNHIEIMKSVFDKKIILAFIYICKYNFFYPHLFESKQKIIDPISFIEELSLYLNSNFKKLIKSLEYGPFYHKKHFKKSKSKIKYNYGLNDAGFKNLIENKFKLHLGYNSSFSTVDLNKSNVKEKEELYNSHFDKMRSTKRKKDAYLDLTNFENEYPFIKIFSKNLQKNPDFDDLSYMNQEPFEEYNSKNLYDFDKFIYENNKNRIFPLKNKNELCLNYDYYGKAGRSRCKNFTSFDKLMGVILKSLYFKKENKDLLIGNVFFPAHNEFFFNDEVMFKSFLYLSYKQIELLDIFELHKFSSIILKAGKFFNLEIPSENENFLHLFLDKYENLKEEFEQNKLREKLVYVIKNTLNSFYTIPENYLIDLYHNIINQLTKITLSIGFVSKNIQSFCIEYYLVYLFKNHYGRDFNFNNKSDIKYISKIAEKHHSSYEMLLEKAFNYTYPSYGKTNSIDIKSEFYDTLDIKNNPHYDPITKSIILNNFKFKILTNFLDIREEGRKMKNCLKYFKDENIKKDILIVSVTHKQENKFRVNFELKSEGIRSLNDLSVCSLFTYCNKGNQLLINELDEALILFKDELLKNKKNLIINNENENFSLTSNLR